MAVKAETDSKPAEAKEEPAKDAAEAKKDGAKKTEPADQGRTEFPSFCVVNLVRRRLVHFLVSFEKNLLTFAWA